MGVCLCGRNRAMSQQMLDISQINIRIQQQGCKRMSEHMWGDTLTGIYPLRVLIQDHANGLIRQRSLTAIQEKIWRIAPNFHLPILC